MKRARNNQKRRGTTIALMCFMIIVIVGMVAVSVEVGRMLVLKNEMQNAVDAGALAATLYLAQDEDGYENAAQAAKVFVRKNRVGSIITIPADAIDVELGQWNGETDVFTATTAEPNAVRVFARSDFEAFFFGRVFGHEFFDAPGDAVATGSAMPLDIMMVLDLSGSMRDEGRIQALWNSSPVFVNVIEDLEGDDQIGVMGLAANPDEYDPVARGHNCVEYDSGLHPTADHYVGVLEATLTNDFNYLRDTILIQANLPDGKYTNYTGTGAALADAVHYLNNGLESRGTARKAVILMSDGHANRPTNNGPGYAMEMCTYAVQHGVRVYTISLGNDADVTLMQNMADASGGKYFDATGTGETELTEKLNEAFKRAAAAMKRSQLVK